MFISYRCQRRILEGREEGKGWCLCHEAIVRKARSDNLVVDAVVEVAER